MHVNSGTTRKSSLGRTVFVHDIDFKILVPVRSKDNRFAVRRKAWPVITNGSRSNRTQSCNAFLAVGCKQISGSNSVKCAPVVRVAMVLNGPRMPLGACGLGSNVSI